MAGRGRPGSAPQTNKREAYARLIAAGVSGCRRAGWWGSTPNGEALATRPHDHQQQRPAADYPR